MNAIVENRDAKSLAGRIAVRPTQGSRDCRIVTSRDGGAIRRRVVDRDGSITSTSAGCRYRDGTGVFGHVVTVRGELQTPDGRFGDRYGRASGAAEKAAAQCDCECFATLDHRIVDDRHGEGLVA